MARGFAHAYRGMVSAVRTQRNMRFHVLVAIAVLVASLFAGVGAVELAVLVLTIVLVLVAEMFNTALEFTVDLVTDEYHPLAKLAKDVSAGAVLVASIGAVAVGFLILGDDLASLSRGAMEGIGRWPVHLTLVALGITALVAVLGGALSGSSTAFSGGMPSGYAAVAFAAWVAASFVAAEGPYAGPVSMIALLLALLVCQSRVESGTRSNFQIAAGGAIGALVAVAVFQLL